jgi:hypothetical protein
VRGATVLGGGIGKIGGAGAVYHLHDGSNRRQGRLVLGGGGGWYWAAAVEGEETGEGESEIGEGRAVKEKPGKNHWGVVVWRTRKPVKWGVDEKKPTERCWRWKMGHLRSF